MGGVTCDLVFINLLGSKSVMGGRCSGSGGGVGGGGGKSTHVTFFFILLQVRLGCM